MGVAVNLGVFVAEGVAVFGFGVGRLGVFVPASVGREAGVSVGVESTADGPVSEGGIQRAERSIPNPTVNRKMMKSGRGFPIQLARASSGLGLVSGSGVESSIRERLMGFMLRDILIERR